MNKTEKIILIAVIILLILFFIHKKIKGSSSPSATEPILRKGDSGPDVTRLNQKLYDMVADWLMGGGTMQYLPEQGGAAITINNAWLNTWIISGYFGAQTESALIALTGKNWIYVKDIDSLQLPNLAAYKIQSAFITNGQLQLL